MIDETGTEAERVGFCQDCGRPLTQGTARVVGSGMFCEPCLQVRLAGAPQAATAGAPATGWTSTSVPPGSTGPVPPTGSVPLGSMPPGTMPPFGGDNPSPVLAGFLGLIPGVGAMYNGQFGKGIIHLVIFFLLESMHRVSGFFFGFLVFLWCLYQAYEAYHTALARREGRPLPDPFGFNDLADRMGLFTHFHMPNGGVPRPGTVPPPFTSAGSQHVGYKPDTGAYAPPPPFVTPLPPVAVPPSSPMPTQGWADSPIVPPVTYEPVATGYAPYPYASPYGSVPAVAPAGFARFPSLAVWLIGLGIMFLLLQINSARWSVAHTVPFFLAVLAIWLFARRMTATGGLLPVESAEGVSETQYLVRLVRQLPLPGMLFVLSVLWALENFHLAYWDTTWPVLLIALGAFLLADRLVPKPPVVFPAAPYSGATSSDGAQKGDR